MYNVFYGGYHSLYVQVKGDLYFFFGVLLEIIDDQIAWKGLGAKLGDLSLAPFLKEEEEKEQSKEKEERVEELIQLS